MPLALVADVETASPQLYFVHADHIDRPAMMTDDAKAVVWEAVYYPFGEAYSITGAATNNLRFPGQYFLIESGLAYNWYRQYDPTFGRYLQPDPAMPERDEPGIQMLSDVVMPSAGQAALLESVIRDIPLGASSDSGVPADGGLGASSSSPLSQLPSEFTDGASLYAYAKSSPAMRSDPKGLQLTVPPFTPIPQRTTQCGSENTPLCIAPYVRCQDLHGNRELINGKRCYNCFEICLNRAYWPFEFCPI